MLAPCHRLLTRNKRSSSQHHGRCRSPSNGSSERSAQSGDQSQARQWLRECYRCEKHGRDYIQGMRDECHRRLSLKISTPSEIAVVMEGDEHGNELGVRVVIEYAVGYDGESMRERVERALKEGNPSSTTMPLTLHPRSRLATSLFGTTSLVLFLVIGMPLTTPLSRSSSRLCRQQDLRTWPETAGGGGGGGRGDRRLLQPDQPEKKTARGS